MTLTKTIAKTSVATQMAVTISAVAVAMSMAVMIGPIMANMAGTVTAASYGCSDTDGGKVWQAKGTASMAGDTGWTDACKNAQVLNEFYCDPIRKYINVAERNCLNGCTDGACNKTAQKVYHDLDVDKNYNISKTELDYGVALFSSNVGYRCGQDAASYAAGSAPRDCRPFHGDSNKDWNVDLVEFGRMTQLSSFSFYQVASGSEDGFGLLDFGCTDTDGGKNGSVKGTVDATGFVMADSCKNTTTLYEMYCDPVRKYANAVEQTCANGCNDGVCK